MRDPKRIDDVLHRLEIVWKEHPDLRFGQLILNVFSLHNGVDKKVYYMEDDELISIIEKAYNDNRRL